MCCTGYQLEASNCAFDTCSPPTSTLSTGVRRHPVFNSVKLADSDAATVVGASTATKTRKTGRWKKPTRGNRELIRLRSLRQFGNVEGQVGEPRAIRPPPPTFASI